MDVLILIAVVSLQIADIMASFGAGITRESVFAREYEPEFSKMISGTCSQHSNNRIKLNDASDFQLS